MKKLLPFLLLILTAPISQGAFVFKQCATNASCGGGATCATAAFGAAKTNPSLLIAFGMSDSGTITSTGFTDSGAGAVPFNASAFVTAVLYEENTSTTTTAITLSTTGSFYSVGVCEYTGAATSSPLEAFCSNANASSTGTGTNNTSCSSAMSLSNSDLIFNSVWPVNGPIVAGTGYTRRVAISGGQCDEFNVTGSQNPNQTDQNGATDAYASIAIAIKPAGGGSTPTGFPVIY